MSAAKYFDPRLTPKNVVHLPVQKSLFFESSFNTEGITGRSGVLVHAPPPQKQQQVLLRGVSVPGHALLCRPKISFKPFPVAMINREDGEQPGQAGSKPPQRRDSLT